MTFGSSETYTSHHLLSLSLPHHVLLTQFKFLRQSGDSPPYPRLPWICSKLLCASLSLFGTYWTKAKPGFNSSLPTPHLHPGSSVGLEENTQTWPVSCEIHDEFQVPPRKSPSGKHTDFSCPLISHSFERLLFFQLLLPHPHTQPTILPPVTLEKLKELRRLPGLPWHPPSHLPSVFLPVIAEQGTTYIPI